MTATALRRTGTLLFSLAVLYLALVLPSRPSWLTANRLTELPLELPVVAFALIALSARPRLARAMATILAILLCVTVLLRLADLVTYEAFSRPFNPVIDRFMLPAALDLMTGTLGRVGAALGIVALLIVLAVLALALLAALRRLARPGPGPGPRRAAGIGAVVVAFLGIADAGRGLELWRLPAEPPGITRTTQVIPRHLSRMAEATRTLAAFRSAAATDPFAGRTDLLNLLDGRDVVVLFIESYGRASFDNPLYAATHTATLQRAADEIAGAGLFMRSGWLTSPTAGGQSWLAHGTFASGLRTGDQARYDAMLASDRRSLWHLAGDAGYRTATIMPAITAPWPEGAMLGFETVLAADDLGYAGDPFNWVTMPDQYTLSAYPARLGDDLRSDFVQVALISSHAPWVPIPPVIDWAEVGDGAVFDEWANSGDPPSVVWRDRDRVRAQYRLAIDYALQVAFSFIARAAEGDPADAPLFVVLGDHQPAGFVAQGDSRDVPVHLVGPPDAMALFDDWAYSGGLVPGADAPVWPMEAFRDRFVGATSSGQGGR